MIKRCVEISERPAYLSLRDGQMVIRHGDDVLSTVPIEDLGVLIVDNPGVTYSHGLLGALLESNTAVVVCGKNHHPAGLLLPLEGHTLQNRAIAAQAAATDGLNNRLWQQIVRAKVLHQGKVLEEQQAESGAFRELAKQVRSGDPDNIEAQAAQRYWPLLFTPAFRRSDSSQFINSFLDYGYTVLRAAVARAIVGAGLNPSLGVHHRNQYNAFALADDLIEPFRPFVDRAVVRLVDGQVDTLGKEAKAELLSVLSVPVGLKGRRMPLMVALHSTAASLRDCYLGERDALEFPEP